MKNNGYFITTINFVAVFVISSIFVLFTYTSNLVDAYFLGRSKNFNSDIYLTNEELENTIIEGTKKYINDLEIDDRFKGIFIPLNFLVEKECVGYGSFSNDNNNPTYKGYIKCIGYTTPGFNDNVLNMEP